MMPHQNRSGTGTAKCQMAMPTITQMTTLTVSNGRLVAMGFQPRRRLEPGRTLTYELANCP